MEKGAFATALNGGGWNGANDRCSIGGLKWVINRRRSKKSADRDLGIEDESRDAHSCECFEAGEFEMCQYARGREGGKGTFLKKTKRAKMR